MSSILLMSGREQFAWADARPQRQPIEGGLRVWAPAKINLNLLVGPRRADGYHGLDSLVAKVTLYDRIDLHRRDDAQVTFACRKDRADPAAAWDCGPDEQNLALRAARLLAGQGAGGGADINLVKHIPPGAGLGGGASDAAAVLEGLNELWRLNRSPAQLSPLAESLGSDVPLFLGPPGLRITGRGEAVEPLRVHPFVAVLFLPDFSTATAAVYRAFDELGGAQGGPRRRGPAVQARLGLELRKPPSRWRQLLHNDLAGAAIRVCPPLGPLWRRLTAALELPVCLTGSGSALFVLCDGVAEAEAVCGRVPRDLGARWVVVRPNGW
jgi:4-diphosphocytidyl-2-C-methyl-D-erythritol kinase